VRLAVVVTGCDSGIGHEVAVHAGRLASRRRGEDGDEKEDGADAEVAVTVFAGCLLESSVRGDRFRGLPHNVRPLLMDVTRDDHVRDAVEAVERWLRNEEEEEEGEKEQLEPPATTTAGAAAVPAAASARRYLHAVVNNAGIGIGADADWLSLDQVQRTMDGTDFC
jgi:NAD(P)-dependent dehydrogenase (short-subunit alcohol dehydrogenase family)